MAKKVEVGTVEAAISNDEDLEHQGGAEEALTMLKKKNFTAMTTENQREATSYTVYQTFDTKKLWEISMFALFSAW